MKNLQKRNSPQKQMWIIISIAFFSYLGLSMPYLIFPSLFLNPEYSILSPEWQSYQTIFLGITLGAYPLGQFIGSPILGALSDDYGRKQTLSISLFMTSIFSFVTAIALEKNLLWLVILSRFTTGFMEGNIAIVRAMAADIKEIDKHTTFGKINASISIAFVLGPIIGALLSEADFQKGFDLSLPFFVISALFLILSFIIFFNVTENKLSFSNKKRTIKERINIFKRVAILFQNPKLRFLLIISYVYTLSVDIFFEFGPSYLTTIWLMPPVELTIYNGILSFSLAIGCAWLAVFLTKHYSNKIIVSTGIFGYAVMLILIAFTSQPIVMAFLFALIGLCMGIPVTNLTVQISDTSPDNIQGEVMGVQSSMRFLGDALICLFGGALMMLSPNVVLLFAAGISFFTFFSYLSSSYSKS